MFVLGSHRPAATPDDVIVDSDPSRLLEQIRNANRGGDVHLVGGPQTVETFRALGALDKRMRLTPSVSTETTLGLESEHALAGGSVELVYAVKG